MICIDTRENEKSVDYLVSVGEIEYVACRVWREGDCYFVDNGRQVEHCTFHADVMCNVWAAIRELVIMHLPYHSALVTLPLKGLGSQA